MLTALKNNYMPETQHLRAGLAYIILAGFNSGFSAGFPNTPGGTWGYSYKARRAYSL